MTTKAVIDKRTGRVIRGGWHHGVGVCRPGQVLADLKTERTKAFDDERAERLEQLERTISTTRDQLARNDIPEHLRAIMEQILSAAERDLASSA